MRYLKFLVFFCLFSFCLGFSAAAESYDMPIEHIDQYPATPDGYVSFVKDTWNVWLYNTREGTGQIDAWENWNDVTTYFFGDDFPLTAEIDPRNIFSQYYMDGGGSLSGSGTSSRYTDSFGGYFYYEYNIGADGKANITYYHIDGNGNKEYVYNISGISDVTSVFPPVVSATDDPRVVRLDIGYSFRAWNGNVYDMPSSTTYTFAEPVEISEVSVSEPVGGVAHGLRGHLERDDDGNLYFVDDDNGTKYPFSPDGLIKFPDGDFPFNLDLRTLTGDQIEELGDELENTTLLFVSTYNNITQSGCNCKDYTDILKYIAKNTDKIYSRLGDINKSIKGLASSDFVGSLLGGLVSALGGVLGDLLDSFFGDFEDDATKIAISSALGSILVALKNLFPTVEIDTLLHTLDNYLFKAGSLQDITINGSVLGYSFNAVVLPASFVSENANGISVVKNLVSIWILYMWLVSMRKKVSSL